MARWKYHKTLQYPSIPQECPLCGNFETSQDHYIRQCPIQIMTQLRHAHISTLQLAIQRQDKTCEPIVKAISQLYLEIALNDQDGYLIWSGMNSRRIVHEIAAEINILDHNIDDKQVQEIRKAIHLIANRLASLTLRLWSKRAEIMKHIIRKINSQLKDSRLQSQALKN